MQYGSAIYLIYFLTKKLAGEFLRLKLTEEQILLRRITGRTFEKSEAARLWRKIGVHKWYLSEKLGRDIGFGAATLDFLENFAGEKGLSAQTDLTPDSYAALNNSFA